MKQCRRKELCVDCADRATCPAAVRRNKRTRRPMACSASLALMRRAARVLAEGWYTCETLGTALYGAPKPGRGGRMSIMVRARRPVNRLYRMGLLAVRPGMRGAAEYTLLPGGEEALR